MALSFPCPDCGTLITVGELLAGGRTSCPKCGAFVSVPDKGTPTGQHVAAGEPPAAPAHQPADAGKFAEGLPRWSPRDLEEPAAIDRLLRINVAISPSAWQLTRIGLSLMYWGIVGIFLAVLAYVALMLFFLIMPGRGGRWDGVDAAAFFGMLMIAILVALVAAFVVIVVGQCLCCTVPAESGARGQAIGSVICLFLSVAMAGALMCLVAGVLRAGIGLGPGAFLRGAPRLVLVGGLLVTVLYITSHILFVLFLRAVGRYFRNDLLVFNTGSYLTMYFIFLGINLAANCVQASVRDPNIGMIFGCIGLILFILVIVVLVWYLRLLAAAQDTIVEATRRME